MNDDALAAVIAAARLLPARDAGESPPEPAPRWALARRLGLTDAERARRAARAQSRWQIGGRLRG